MDKKKLESYAHYWNPLLMRVLSGYVSDQGCYLFGITGDIDNLGIYVAKNGRAKAENLVDLYNQIIRNEMIRWARENHGKLRDYTFVASGEEMLALGVSTERELVDTLFAVIHSRLNQLIRDNPYIDIGETGISFGCALLDESDLKEKIVQMVTVMQQMTGEDEYVLYVEIMERIREVLARELDKEKFRSLMTSTGANEVLFRNFVYVHMLDYKYHTALSLKSLAHSLQENSNPENLAPLRDRYGLDSQNRRMAIELKEKIDSRD